MKYLFSSALIVTLLFSISSCSEELDLSGEFKETAVVYGLLDKNNTTHMIKINRAFIGPGNSLQIAKEPDSSYFTNVQVTITEKDALGTYRSWTLQDTIIDNKDENGVFYAPEQKLYYFNTLESEPLLGNKDYELRIIVDNGLFEITSSTRIVDNMTATTLSSANAQLKLASNPSEYEVYPININSGNASIISAEIDVKINERISGSYQAKHLSWFIGEREVESSSTNFSILGQNFYQRIKDELSNSDPLVDRRLLDTITFTFTGGGVDLYNYMIVNQPSSSLTQTKPTFTNLKATNGYEAIGIFSSRQTVVIEKPFHLGGGQAFVRSIDSKSTQELCQGSITGELLFCSDHPGDLAPFLKPWACN